MTIFKNLLLKIKVQINQRKMGKIKFLNFVDLLEDLKDLNNLRNH